MGPAAFRIAARQHLVGGVEEENSRLETVRFEFGECFGSLGEEDALARVNAERDTGQ
jgi:hypothetical protein